MPVKRGATQHTFAFSNRPVHVPSNMLNAQLCEPFIARTADGQTVYGWRSAIKVGVKAPVHVFGLLEHVPCRSSSHSYADHSSTLPR
jgi:hypothetical protein